METFSPVKSSLDKQQQAWAVTRQASWTPIKFQLPFLVITDAPLLETYSCQSVYAPRE